jgi:hypothetical protein
LKYDASTLCTENILTEVCPPYLTDLRAYLRTHTYLAVYIQGTSTTSAYFEELQTQFRQDKEKDPALAWYLDATRPVIQKGQYLKKSPIPIPPHYEHTKRQYTKDGDLIAIVSDAIYHTDPSLHYGNISKRTTKGIVSLAFMMDATSHLNSKPL